MGIKRALALLFALALILGMISSASAATTPCKFCREPATLVLEDAEGQHYGIVYKPYSGSGPHYFREEWDCLHYYECGYCHLDFEKVVRHYGPWEIDTDWV